MDCSPSLPCNQSVYFNCRRAFVSASFVLGVDALLAAAVYGMVVATVPALAMPKTYA